MPGPPVRSSHDRTSLRASELAERCVCRRLRGDRSLVFTTRVFLDGVARHDGAPVSSLFDLSGHVALVTGGNSGIGLGMAEGLAAQGAVDRHLGDQPGEERRRRRAALGVRGRRPRRGLRRRRPGGGRVLDGRDGRRTGPYRLVLRQRRRRWGRAELPRDDRRRVAPPAARQPRRRVLHGPGSDPAHGRPLRGRRHRWWFARVHELGRGVLRPTEGPALRARRRPGSSP